MTYIPLALMVLQFVMGITPKVVEHLKKQNIPIHKKDLLGQCHPYASLFSLFSLILHK